MSDNGSGNFFAVDRRAWAKERLRTFTSDPGQAIRQDAAVPPTVGDTIKTDLRRTGTSPASNEGHPPRRSPAEPPKEDSALDGVAAHEDVKIE